MKRLLVTFCFIFSVFITPVAFSKERDTIYIYSDEGVSEESLSQTISTFKTLLQKYALTTINAEEVKKGVWTKNAILFVMPGGADLPYVKKLNGKGNEIIKQYVTSGGSFLGICAGSYYGSSYVQFDKNGPLEVLGNRELAFFRGSAIGPVLAPYDYKTQSGSRAATIHTILPNVTETIVFYNGGGFFENAGKQPSTEVVATYDNNLPAIIIVNYGKGKVLLSGVHFEYDPFLLDSKDKHIGNIIEQLSKGNNSRKVLFNDLMKLIRVG